MHEHLEPNFYKDGKVIELSSCKLENWKTNKQGESFCDLQSTAWPVTSCLLIRKENVDTLIEISGKAMGRNTGNISRRDKIPAKMKKTMSNFVISRKLNLIISYGLATSSLLL